MDERMLGISQKIFLLLLIATFCYNNLAQAETLTCPPKQIDSLKSKIEKTIKNFPTNPKITGTVQVDYAHYKSSVTRLGDGAIIRRAYFGVLGQVTEDWSYILTVDFARNRVRLRDAWLMYEGFKPTTIRIGHMKEPLFLEHLMSDTNLTFLERSLPNAFIIERRTGINVDTHGKWINSYNYYVASAGLFSVDAGHDRTYESDDGWSIDGRLAYAFHPCDEILLHLGISGTFRKPDSNGEFNFRSKPESDVTNVTFVNTETIFGVRNFKTIGLEAATVLGPLSLQAEYMDTSMVRKNTIVDGELVENPNLKFKGYYGYASLFLTGESRPYDTHKAIFTSLKPCHCYGAWEIAARYSNLNLTDDSIIGGQEHNTTLALNWYPNENVRFMFNYIRVYANQAGLNNKPSVYTIRGQITW